jgi:hypothetical protein
MADRAMNDSKRDQRTEPFEHDLPRGPGLPAQAGLSAMLLAEIDALG